MAYTSPTGDFVTSTLQGAINATATTATIGTGLDIPATNGILQIDYDSTTAKNSAADAPETVTYATYNTATGALTGLVRGAANTDNGTAAQGPTHQSGASVACGPSVLYYQQSPQYDTWNSAGTLSYSAADSPTFTVVVSSSDETGNLYPGVRVSCQQDEALDFYWSFNADTNADVGTATVSAIGGTVVSASGAKFGAAGLSLNGTSQALGITDAAGFKPTGDFTLGMWIKPTASASGKHIFQSYSDNTNANGIRILIQGGTGFIYAAVGNNAASDTTVFTGTTDLTGDWHYVVWSYRNNYSQIYVDGKLECSGYTVTPTYAATNYVRIGVSNVAGSSVASTWFDGQIDDLFLINGYALDEKTIKAKYDAATAQGTSDITVTKYFLVTSSVLAGAHTHVTLYGGTDYALSDSTISNAYYSTQKAPYGFPLSKDKWRLIVQDSTQRAQQNPTTNTWYNLGSQSISVPIGSWTVSYRVSPASLHATASEVQTCLGYTSSSSTGPSSQACVYALATQSGEITVVGSEDMSVATKRSIYLNTRSVTNSVTYIYNQNQIIPSLITATSTLL